MNLKDRLKHCIFLIAGLFIFTTVNGQKVALVLSGGGSKGVSHVGVIKALEENDIPIDYIAGTSMGAIIGAMYASGYSVEEMEELLVSDEVKRWASGEIADSYRYYFKKEEVDAAWINIPFDFSKKIIPQLPTNIIAPYQMDFAFMQYFGPPSAAAHYNFDSLMIPFRCVAADIDSNKAVVLNSGNLCKAVRASMTYPFYFKPIKINGKLLFDGGMYNNFPADVAIEDFQPDVIIGSKAAGNYDSPDQDDVISQIQNMLMENTDYSLRGKRGIIIKPQLDAVNVIDFSRSREMIDSGYIETIRNIDKIRQLVYDNQPYTRKAALRKNFNDEKPPLIIDSIKVAGLNRNQEVYVNKILKRGKHYITIDELKSEYFKLIADNKFDYIYPQLHHNDNSGFYDVYLDVKRVNRFLARFGGNISSGTVNEAFIGLQYNHLGRSAFRILQNAYFGRFYTSFKLSGRFDFASVTPSFIDLSFVYNHWDYFRNTTYFFEDKDPSFLIKRDNHWSFKWGFPATNKGKLILGINHGHLKYEYYQTNTFTRLDTADRTYFEPVSPFVTYELNSLNRKQYASSGAKLSFTLRYVYGNYEDIPGSTSKEEDISKGNQDYFSFKLAWENYFKSFEIMKIGFYGELYISNQDFFTNYTSSILAARSFKPIPESKTLFLPNYRAYNYAAAGFMNVFNIQKNLDFRISGYIMQPYRAIVKDEESQDAVYTDKFETRSFMGSASLVFHSPVGPVSLSLNFYDRTHDQFSFVFNFGYLIFNESVLD